MQVQCPRYTSLCVASLGFEKEATPAVEVASKQYKSQFFCFYFTGTGRQHQASSHSGYSWLQVHKRGSGLGVLANIFADTHRAELGTAHAAKGRGLEGILGQRLVVHPARGLRVEREAELVFPVELIAGAADGIVT